MTTTQAYIQISLADLWNRYSGGKQSGRAVCPVQVVGHEHHATHIYCGFGSIRLERIIGVPIMGKRGFQGTEIISAPITRAGEPIRIFD